MTTRASARTANSGYGIALEPLDNIVEINGKRFKVQIWKNGQVFDPSLSPRDLQAISRSYSSLFQNMLPRVQREIMRATPRDHIVFSHNARHDVVEYTNYSDERDRTGTLIASQHLFQRHADASMQTLSQIGKALRGEAHAPREHVPQVSPQTSSQVSPFEEGWDGLDPQVGSEGLCAYEIVENAIKAIRNGSDDVLEGLKNGDAEQRLAANAFFDIRDQLEEGGEVFDDFDVATDQRTASLLAAYFDADDEESESPSSQVRSFTDYLQSAKGYVYDECDYKTDFLEDEAFELGDRIFVERPGGVVEVYGDEDGRPPNALDIFLLDDGRQIHQLKPPAKPPVKPLARPAFRSAGGVPLSRFPQTVGSVSERERQAMRQSLLSQQQVRFS